MRFSIPHRRRRVFSFFDFRSSFPVFPTSLKLRAKKDLSKIDYAKAWDYLTFCVADFFFSREASRKSEKREKKNENRKMKTPVYDGEEGTFFKTPQKLPEFC